MKAGFTNGEVLCVVGIIGVLGVLGGGNVPRGYEKDRTYQAPALPRDEALEAKLSRNREVAGQERIQKAAEKRARKAAKKGSL